jgi:hypothetical protein
VRLRALVVSLALALTACIETVSPARTFDAYEHKAKDTAESVLSSVETARLVAKAAGDGDTFGPYASVLLGDAEKGAGHAQDVFDSVQPPDAHSDRLRDELGKLLEDASDHLSELRIAARRHELERLPELAAPLRKISKQLNAFITEHE